MQRLATRTAGETGWPAPASEPSDSPALLSELESAPTSANIETSRRRDTGRRRLLALADVVGLLIAMGLAWVIEAPKAEGLSLAALAVAIPAWILFNKLLGLYDRDANLIHKSTLDDLPRLSLSIILGVSFGFLVAPVIGFDMQRGPALQFLLVALIALPCLRGIVRAFVVQHYPPERCVIVGSGVVTELVARKVGVHPEYGVDLVGFVDPEDADLPGMNGMRVQHLGGLDRYVQLCREHEIERVVVGFSSLDHEDLMDVIRESKGLGMKITVVPRLFEIMGSSVEVDQLEGMTLLGLRGLARTKSSLRLKRAIDMSISAAGLVLLFPLLLAIALAIKVASRGPVFFAQERIGRGNRRFRIVKFRTMVQDAEDRKSDLAHLNEVDGPMFKIAEDPRVFGVGRFLRRTSLDELPQLINVLRGEMSLVGPRPLVPDEDQEVIGHHRERLDLTPGLTGPWQVLGRTSIPFQEMVKLDYLYVAEWSLWNDFKLLVQTAPVVLQARGR